MSNGLPPLLYGCGWQTYFLYSIGGFLLEAKAKDIFTTGIAGGFLTLKRKIKKLNHPKVIELFLLNKEFFKSSSHLIKGRNANFKHSALKIIQLIEFSEVYLF